jgi:hypothetical protein
MVDVGVCECESVGVKLGTKVGVGSGVSLVRKIEADASSEAVSSRFGLGIDVADTTVTGVKVISIEGDAVVAADLDIEGDGVGSIEGDAVAADLEGEGDGEGVPVIVLDAEIEEDGDIVGEVEILGDGVT